MVTAEFGVLVRVGLQHNLHVAEDRAARQHCSDVSSGSRQLPSATPRHNATDAGLWVVRRGATASVGMRRTD